MNRNPNEPIYANHSFIKKNREREREKTVSMDINPMVIILMQIQQNIYYYFNSTVFEIIKYEKKGPANCIYYCN